MNYGPFSSSAARVCYCGRPADEDFLGMPRCARCATDDPVEEPGELAAHALPVFRALREAGVPLSGNISTQLVSREYFGPVLEGSGAIALGRIEERGRYGANPDDIIITVVAGFPDPLYRRVLAHQVGHAFLMSRGVVDADSWIEEGVAEYFAHLYLGRPEASPVERLLDAEVGKASMRYLDTAYCSIVREGIERRGLLTVVDALVAGDPKSVGLA